ncbi:MAG TPA: TauD/TfdA family dioxygenase [Acidimicrobiales bacterium]
MQTTDIHPGFGVRIDGLDPSGEIDPVDQARLRELFDERSVLVFGGLDIDVHAQDRFCRMLIDDDGPGMAADRAPMLISNTEPGGNAPFGRLLFHADMMWAPEPFQVLSLYGVVAEPGAATTSLTSGVHAWDLLPEELRRRVEGLHARHVTGQVYSRGGDDLLRPERTTEQSTVTPVVRRHPRTGRPVLYVSQQMTAQIVELEPEPSEELLQELFAHLYDPAIVYEHTWQAGDLVVFDNLAMQHARGNVELDGPARTLRKVIAPIPALPAERPTFAGATR